jgi:hypothetical protein
MNRLCFLAFLILTLTAHAEDTMSAREQYDVEVATVKKKPLSETADWNVSIVEDTVAVGLVGRGVYEMFDTGKKISIVEANATQALREQRRALEKANKVREDLWQSKIMGVSDKEARKAADRAVVLAKQSYIKAAKELLSNIRAERSTLTTWQTSRIKEELTAAEEAGFLKVALGGVVILDIGRRIFFVTEEQDSITPSSKDVFDVMPPAPMGRHH